MAFIQANSFLRVDQIMYTVLFFLYLLINFPLPYEDLNGEIAVWNSWITSWRQDLIISIQI